MIYWRLRYEIHKWSHPWRTGNFCIRCGAKL